MPYSGTKVQYRTVPNFDKSSALRGFKKHVDISNIVKVQIEIQLKMIMGVSWNPAHRTFPGRQLINKSPRARVSQGRADIVGCS